MLSRTLLALSLAVAVVSSAHAQTAPPAPGVDGGTPVYVREETPKQRMERIGISEDPGLDPDPAKVWVRFGKKYTIEKYERRWAVYDQEAGFVRPFGFANFRREIYQQNEKWVWVWQEIQTEEEKARALEEFLAQEKKEEPTDKRLQIEYLRTMRGEFEALAPASSDKKVTFEESSQGLPTIGSWRNHPAIADMNEDGNLDIVAPPERVSGAATPVIYLGDGKGNWTLWKDVTWPYGIQYGGAAAADFNKDGHMDIAFAVHLTGVRVFLGDGKGKFVDFSEGLSSDQYPTRRLTVVDLDLDGYPDILTINEGPVVKSLKGQAYSKVRAYMNRGGKKWEIANAADPKNAFGGDWLAVGKFNSDRYPDFVGSSIFFHGTQIIHLSSAKGTWKAIDTTKGDIVPFMSYYMAVGAGRFSSRNLDDAILSYVRFWPAEVAKGEVTTPALQQIVGLDRITFAGGTPRRVPIARWAGSRGISGMGEGDFDGDGNLDFLVAASEPREFMLFLGDGKGGFKRAAIDGIPPTDNTTYDVAVADVNRDKRPDLVLLFESSGGGLEAASRGQATSTYDGSIRVFLNRGAASPVVAAKKTE